MKIKNILATTAVAAAAATISVPASAKQFWSDFSVSYLSGSDYLNPFSGNEYGSNVMTLEHASGHSWGSTFTFVDFLNSDEGVANETYGEIGANYSLGNHFGKPAEGSFVNASRFTRINVMASWVARIRSGFDEGNPIRCLSRLAPPSVRARLQN